MNIDTKLFRYSTTRLSNYDGNESHRFFANFRERKEEREKRKVVFHRFNYIQALSVYQIHTKAWVEEGSIDLPEGCEYR